jgi:hypothetical protein
MRINALVQIVQRNQSADVYVYDAVVVALVLENTGAPGHANASNNTFASWRSTVSKPSVNQW